MKFPRIYLIVFAAMFFSISVSASNNSAKSVFHSDSVDININAEISLWYEYHKNGDFNTAINHAWNIVKVQPEFTKYKFYKKLEEMIWYFHDSLDAGDPMHQLAMDTVLYVYDLALTHDDSPDYYLPRKAFVVETWFDFEPEVSIEAYNAALESNPELDSYYVDRLANIYIGQEDKIAALELYSKLAEKNPDDPRWNEKMLSLADNPEELVELTKKAWDLDKDNLEKAWKFANTALRIKDYETAIEPLEFLTVKSPEVINYWKQLATAYDKLDKTDKAIDAYKKLIELQPDGRDNYVNLALIYKKMEQLSVARTYLQKATKADPDWDYPYWIEGQLYEQAARNCVRDKFEFEDKLVYQLAVDTYRRAATKGGTYGVMAKDRANSLGTSVPEQADYFFRKYKAGDVIDVKGKCYDWIGRSITVPN
ncbi:MAG: hypothetical protein SCALA702_28940 [Melioribacteraceae bacterium]|nr:MAG: hypothetical protein SCALA702_28940 [Melioribacteraceae bacterium]